jgi:hypothetical protein
MRGQRRKRDRKRDRERAEGLVAEAGERLAEARELKARTERRAPVVDALAEEAARLAKRNSIAEIVYRGLMNGGNA